MNFSKSNKALIVLAFFLLLGLPSKIMANDLVVFKNGTVQIGEIVSYQKQDFIKFKSIDGVVNDYPYNDILATRTNIDSDNIIAQSLSPTFNMITYYPRDKDGIYELSPRYKYKSQIFKMESEWGRETEILEFFDMIEQDNIDDNTASLINQLKADMSKQSKIIRNAAIFQLSGLTLLMVSFFVMDDSVSPPTIPNWSKWVSGAGVSLDLIGLGLLISQIGVNQDKYLEKIADSFNKNLLNR